MKKNILLSVLAISLLAIAFFMSRDSKSDTTASINAERDFNIDSRDNLPGFRITKKGKEPLEFIKNKKGDWILNDKYLAGELTVAAALAVFERARLEFIPNSKAVPSILANMKNEGIKIEYLDKNRSVTKSYTMGGVAKDGETFFLLDGYTQPYAMAMSGFDGILRNRFDHPLDQWRSPIMFREKESDIKRVSVEYPKDKENSFEIVREGDEFVVKTMFPATPKINRPPNASILDAYINGFNSLYAEGFENRNFRQDSILRHIPFARLEVELRDTVKKFDFYPFLTGSDPNLNPSDYRDAVKINRYYTKANNGDFLLTQQYVVGKYFMAYNGFFD